MAKAKDLAGLAALGALGYMLTRGKANENAGSQKSSSYTGDTKKVGADASLESPEDTIKRSMKKAPEAEDANYGNEGRRTSMGVAPTASVKQRLSPAAVADNTTGITMPSGSPDSEAGMGRGTRPADRRLAETGTSRGTRKTSVSGAGRGTINPSNVAASDARSAESGMSRGTRTTSTAGAGRGSLNPASVKPSGARDLESGMSRGTRTPAPPFKGGQPGYDEAGNFMGGRGGYDEAGNPMKKGGAVKKMASGGMTASRRADGIASRGKTRCKMY